MTRLLSLGLIATLMSSVGCFSKKTEPVGSQTNPLKMYFVPSEDTDALSNTAKDVAEFLSKSVSQKLYGKDTGFYVTAAIPASYVAVVEAFGTKRADFAVMNSYGYYLLKHKKKYPGEAILRILRGEGQKTYKAQIIARADSKINTLKDLKGKKFAYTDPASTAGYIVPSIMLKENNIDLGEVVFAQRHDNVVSMVYSGQVDAGATYHNVDNPDGSPNDARVRVMKQYPDVLEKVKIVEFTQGIPNAPWILRTNMFGDDTETYTKVKTAVVESMLEFAKQGEGMEVLKKLYGITGLAESQDSDFDILVDMFAKAELNPDAIQKASK